ncbi:MAG: circularly permuted type 2 ATP-grasp protein [Alphaproteobacteria bacterium]
MSIPHQTSDAEKDSRGPGLANGYWPVEGAYDEMVDANGNVRPHWRAVLDELDATRRVELEGAWETAQRLIRENGTTYNVYDEENGGARPWRMDPVPFIIDAAEWRQLEAGLTQRATLLNAIVADLYGPQTLLREGRIPPAIIFENPNFLRPLHGVVPPGNVHLQFMAVDLARAANNTWWVVSDRTQAPSGAGYALENRLVMRRSLPTVFRNAPVQRLAAFFQAFSDNLVAQTGRENPLIVLMTPGPSNETFFEHAYLARYLGYPLVEGADLTVRDSRVYLKTLSGLRQVDLIYRRVDGDFCDPLELRTESLLGVAGLVAAVRAGNVVVANSLGSGIVECEALMGFLPGLCRHLLGDDLILPSVATWWCGQEKERDFVLNNLDNLVLRPTFSNRTILTDRMHSVLPQQLSDPDRRAIVERLVSRERDFIGQEVLPLSTTPAWRDGGLRPSPMMLRVFICADGGGYRVMPGGLTRISDEPYTHAVSMQQGDASKDTWVLSDGPVSTFSRLPVLEGGSVLRRSGENIPSRVADNLLWLGRYAERTESTVRLMRSLIRRMLGEVGATDDPVILRRLIGILTGLGYLPKRSARRAESAGLSAFEREIGNLLFDRNVNNGLLSLLGNLMRTASLVRDRLSEDAWQILDMPHRLAARYAGMAPIGIDNAHAFLNELLRLLTAFNGMQMENMTRSVGWRLLDVGRRIERSGHTAILIRELAGAGNPESDGGLDLLLELGDSTMTYRTRYLTTAQFAPVLDLLMCDETNPRSLIFQANVLNEHIAALPRDVRMATLTNQEYLVEEMRSSLKLAMVYELADSRDSRGRRVKLDRFLRRQQEMAVMLSDDISRAYFTHVLPIRSGSSRRQP